EEDFGTGAHADQFVRQVISFAEDAPRLGDESGVNFRQQGGVVADVILYDQHDGHAHLQRVMLHIAPVLNGFDDGEEEAWIALPEKNLLNALQRTAPHQRLDLLMIEAEDSDGNVETGKTHGGGKVEAIHIR